MLARQTFRFITLSLLLVAAGGCGGLVTEYGSTTSNAGRKSVAGFGVLRDVYRRNGWNDRTLSRLSERLNNVDTIVWIPDSELPLDSAATEWFETWLSRGDKTLIYVLKDHQTEPQYWREAARLAPPDQRLEYRRRVARSQMDLQKQLLVRPGVITNGWFTATPLSPPTIVGQLAGGGSNDGSAALATDSREIEYDVAAYNQVPATATTVGGGPLGGPQFMFREYKPTETNVDFKVLLTTNSGTALVSEITYEDWDNSNILVVSAGSLLTNFGMIYPNSRQLASFLLTNSHFDDDEDLPKVGFLSTDDMGVNISSLDPRNAGPTGMELFTTWPLSVITIHAFIFGLLVCLMLLPIFGRPRRLPGKPTADFADHIDAVAGLMQRTKGTEYAKVRISEYMVRVRGETDGPWVIKQPPANEQQQNT